MIQPHRFYQIYISFLDQTDCTPPKGGKLSEYTDSAHTEVEDLSSRYINGSKISSTIWAWPMFGCHQGFVEYVSSLINFYNSGLVKNIHQPEAKFTPYLKKIFV